MPQNIKYIDMAKILKGMEGKWVALSSGIPDRHQEYSVVGSGDSIDEAMAEAAQKGEKDPILIKVPLKNVPYIL